MTLRVDLDLPVGHLFQGVQILQQTALEKLAAKKKYVAFKGDFLNYVK